MLVLDRIHGLANPAQDNPRSKSARIAAGTSQQIHPRKFKVDFDPANIERTWIKHDHFLTAWMNAYSMTVPDGERLIIRTLRHYLDQIEDPQLKENVLRVMRQESTHTQGHQKFIQLLRDQGYEIDRLAKFVHWINTRILERITPPIVHLAFIVGVERFNELIADFTLRDGKLDSAETPVRALYEWHFAEEIEHKSVVFDVFNAVSGSRLLLGYGALFSLAVIMTYLAAFTALFLAADRKLLSPKVWRSAARYFFSEEKFLPRMLSGFWDALKKGFHPSQTDNQDLAAHILKRSEITA